MPDGREGNCKSGVALDLRHKHRPPMGSMSKRGKWAPCLHYSRHIADFTFHPVVKASSLTCCVLGWLCSCFQQVNGRHVLHRDRRLRRRHNELQNARRQLIPEQRELTERTRGNNAVAAGSRSAWVLAVPRRLHDHAQQRHDLTVVDVIETGVCQHTLDLNLTTPISSLLQYW